jgi:hypothetical protein
MASLYTALPVVVVLIERHSVLLIFILTLAPMASLYTALPVVVVVTYFKGTLLRCSNFALFI